MTTETSASKNGYDSYADAYPDPDADPDAYPGYDYDYDGYADDSDYDDADDGGLVCTASELIGTGTGPDSAQDALLEALDSIDQDTGLAGYADTDDMAKELEDSLKRMLAAHGMCIESDGTRDCIVHDPDGGKPIPDRETLDLLMQDWVETDFRDITSRHIRQDDGIGTETA